MTRSTISPGLSTWRGIDPGVLLIERVTAFTVGFTRPPYMFQASLLFGISRIVRLRSGKKVLWVGAPPDIALVEDVKTTRDRSLKNNP